MDAALPLRDLGIKVRMDKQEEILRARWSVQGKGGRGSTTALSDADLQAFGVNRSKYVSSTFKLDISDSECE